MDWNSFLYIEISKFLIQIWLNPGPLKAEGVKPNWNYYQCHFEDQEISPDWRLTYCLQEGSLPYLIWSPSEKAGQEKLLGVVQDVKDPNLDSALSQLKDEDIFFKWLQSFLYLNKIFILENF